MPSIELLQEQIKDDRIIKLLVISDIHSHKKKQDGLQGGYYFPNMPESPISQNPFASLKELIRKKDIQFDYILAPGDFAHQIDPEGLKSSWDQLKLIKNEGNADKLVATIGNHDVASRETGDAFKHIRQFDSDFPVYMKYTGPNDYKSKLLEQGYYFIDDESLDILFVVINSCFDHWDKIEASKGKIQTEKLDDIQNLISNSKRRIKIALIHHHPIIHETGIFDTGDVIEGSEELMKHLIGIDLIVHGHKHDYRFTQNTIFPKNLNVLSSGSFSCFKTYLKSSSLNYFHEIEFHTNNVTNCINQGVIKTYAYDPTSGWTRYKNLDEGFGCILNISEIKIYLTNIFKNISEPYIQWSELVELNPILKYISTSSLKSALDLLKNDSVIKRYNNDSNMIGDIGDIILR